MLFAIIVSTLCLSGGVYALLSYDPAVARRQALRDANVSWVYRTWDLRHRLISRTQRERMRVIGVEESKYLQDLAVYTLGGLVVGEVFLHSLPIGIVGACLGYVLVWMRVAGKYGRWQKDVVGGIQELVRIIKLRMAAGEKVSTAMERTLPFLTDAMAIEWGNMLARLRSGESVETALQALDQRIGDRDLTAVLTRLRTYHRTGIPEDPFGDLAEHLSRIYMIQHEGRMKRLTAPLTMYALAGFVGVFMIAMLPTIILQILQALKGSPLTF